MQEGHRDTRADGGGVAQRHDRGAVEGSVQGGPVERLGDPQHGALAEAHHADGVVAAAGDEAANYPDGGGQAAVFAQVARRHARRLVEHDHQVESRGQEHLLLAHPRRAGSGDDQQRGGQPERGAGRDGERARHAAVHERGAGPPLQRHTQHAAAPRTEVDQVDGRRHQQQHAQQQRLLKAPHRFLPAGVRRAPPGSRRLPAPA